MIQACEIMSVHLVNNAMIHSSTISTCVSFGDLDEVEKNFIPHFWVALFKKPLYLYVINILYLFLSIANIHQQYLP